MNKAAFFCNRRWQPAVPCRVTQEKSGVVMQEFRLIDGRRCSSLPRDINRSSPAPLHHSLWPGGAVPNGQPKQLRHNHLQKRQHQRDYRRVDASKATINTPRRLVSLELCRGVRQLQDTWCTILVSFQLQKDWGHTSILPRACTRGKMHADPSLFLKTPLFSFTARLFSNQNSRAPH